MPISRATHALASALTAGLLLAFATGGGVAEAALLDTPSVAASLDPAEGPEIGGTTVTITGTGFLGATAVTFDGIAGTSFTIVDDTAVTIVTPVHAPGPVDVVVHDPSGNSAALAYLYLNDNSAATSLTPTAGPESGGTRLTITGTGFYGAAGVDFDGFSGTGFSIIDGSTITVVTPAHTAGPVAVTVLDRYGNSAPLAFEYGGVAAVAASLNPILGPVTGGTPVTINGTGFLRATGVTFDTLPGAGVEVLSDNMMVVVSPPHGAGLVDVVVQNPAGDSAPLVFEYGPRPSVVTTLTPTSGTSLGGTTVTLNGAGFTGSIGVVFAGLAGTDFVVVNDTTVTVVTPPHAPGAVDVIVLDAGGDSEPVGFAFVGVAPGPESPAPAEGESPGSGIPGSGIPGSGSAAPGIPAIPATGVDAAAPLTLAALLVVAGGLLVMLARRRVAAVRRAGGYAVKAG